MKTISTSKLSDVKSVFNSEADNEQYFKVLKNSNSSKLYNVELAKPVVRKNKGLIVWQTESLANFKPLSEIEENKRLEIGSVLENFFKLFKNRIDKFSNIPEEFVEKIMAIPDSDSILVSESEDYIIIVNWGFLKDKFNRKEGVIETLFPVPDQSVLVKLVNEKKEPISNQKIYLHVEASTRTDVTNSKGYARFGSLTRGKKFGLSCIHNKTKKEQTYDFICDGRDEYEIQITENVKIKFTIKSNSGDLIKDRSFYVKSKTYNDKEFKTKQLGSFSFEHEITDDIIKLKDEHDNIIFEANVPYEDTNYIIDIDDKPSDHNTSNDKAEEEIDESHNFKVVFLNSFNKPLKNLDVSFDYDGYEFSKITDDSGAVYLQLEDATSELNYTFRRYRVDWTDQLFLSQGKDVYYIKTKPIFPWLWWILILALIVLLLCCYFGECFCNSNSYNNLEDKNNTKNQIVTSKCNVETVSGGSGITRTRHILGKKSGKVSVYYNMETIPDKLEVFYQKELVTSTYDIRGNKDGFVGESLPSGGIAKIGFNYEMDNENYVTVVVTGSQSDTAWNYKISCPTKIK